MNALAHFEKTTEKTVTLGGVAVRYTATAADFLLENPGGQAECTLFHYSYVRQPEACSRPVIFAYNGGPGSDSIWLHLGLLGPKRLVVGDPPDFGLEFPYALADNEACLLDVCDIVLIDPVGAGYSALATPEAGDRYYETVADGQSFARLIEGWIARHGRWDSPVYLVGESYGTIRNVAVADCLSEAVHLAGIVSVGTSINHGHPELQVEPNVRKFGSYAAAAWFHKGAGKPELAEHLRQAEAFAYGDYARALLLGNTLPDNERAHVLEQLMYFTGLSESYLVGHKLRIELDDYLQELCPGELLSPYDVRIKSPCLTRFSFENMDRKLEPSNMHIGPALQACFSKYLAQDLELGGIGRPYLHNMGTIARQWDFGTLKPDAMVLLERIMQRKPQLRVLFINGLYDMLSTASFVPYYLSQHDIPRERAVVRAYESGHMTYFGAPFEAVAHDIRLFVTGGVL